MDVNKVNHIENILQEISFVQRQLFDLNTQLGNLSLELIKASSTKTYALVDGHSYREEDSGWTVSNLGTVMSSKPPNDTW